MLIQGDFICPRFQSAIFNSKCCIFFLIPQTSEFYFIFKNFNFTGSRVDLQCCVSFKFKAKWFSYAAAKSLQSCLTLCDPINVSPPGSPAPGILQARTLEWVAISFSNAWKWKVKVKSLSHVRPSATPWTAANQAPPSMGFARQEYWSGVPLPSPIQLYNTYSFSVPCWLLE